MTAGRTSTTDKKDWGTPRHYIDAVKRVFGGSISLDPCSNEFSVVGAETEYRLPKVDGLVASWDFPTIYVNPPYGHDKERGTTIKDWLKQCADAHERFNASVIALVPVATNTKHWKVHVWDRATAVCFLSDTRLKFLINGACGGKGAPMSCAAVYWGFKYDRFAGVFSEFGALVDLRPVRGNRERINLPLLSRSHTTSLTSQRAK